MASIKEIIDYLNSWAKPEYSLSWDNSGSQIYMGDTDTKSVILSMDMHDEALKLAKREGAKLIITHHPFFFGSFKDISSGSYRGDIIIDMIKSDISLYSAHTTLDIANEGVNDAFFDFLNLKEKKNLAVEEDKNLGLIGELEKSTNYDELKEYLEDNLNIKSIKGYGKKPSGIKKIALMGGAGFEFFKQAQNKDADIYITSDLKYHDGQAVYENGFCVMDLGHFYSEKIVLKRIEEKLSEKFSNLKFFIIEESTFEI